MNKLNTPTIVQTQPILSKENLQIVAMECTYQILKIPTTKVHRFTIPSWQPLQHELRIQTATCPCFFRTKADAGLSSIRMQRMVLRFMVHSPKTLGIPTQHTLLLLPLWSLSSGQNHLDTSWVVATGCTMACLLFQLMRLSRLVVAGTSWPWH